MPTWDSQTFAFRSYEATDVSIRLHNVALKGAVPDLIVSAPADLPMEVAGQLRLNAYEELEDHTLERWSKLLVALEASAGEGELFLQATCDKTRLELTTPMQREAPTTLEVSTRDIRGSIFVRAVLTRANGLMIGESPPIEIVVDRPALIAGGGLRVEWRSDKFKDRPGALSFVETLGVEPILYLNDAIPDFYALMTSHRRGIAGALRRYLLTQIEVDAWLALGGFVLRALVEGEVGLADEELDDDLIDDVLDEKCKAILRRLRDLTGAENLVDTVSLLRDPEDPERARTAVCSRVSDQPAKLLDGLIAAVGRNQ